MKKRVLAGLLTAAIAASALTGCGSGDSASNGGNKNAKYQVGVLQLVQHPALDRATEGFKAALHDKLGSEVNIDVQNAAGDTAQCSTIANSFVSAGDDLIFANATGALQAAAAATADIPIVGTSVTDYATALSIDNWSGTTGKNITGTSDLAPLDQQADMLEELFPVADYSKVGIIYCSAEANSKYQADEITKVLTAKGYTVEAFQFSDSNDVASVTQSACDASDVLYVPTDNTAANCAENINNVALPAKTPIIAGEEGICAGCGVATLTIDYYDLGYAAGEMAYDILVNGADPATMQIEYAPEVTKEYNADICEKLGVEIPADYTAIKKDK